MKPIRTAAGLILAALLPIAASGDEKPGSPKPTAEAEPRRERDAKPHRQGHPDGRPHHPGPPGEAARMEKRPWLGVATALIDPAVRRHLDLPEGFGVAVDYVVEDSPAASAGIQEHDILIRLDDQRLTTPEHLSLLVRSLSKGDGISLTLIRKGQEETVKVVLGENEVPAQPEWPRSYGFQAEPVPGHPHLWQFQGQLPLPAAPGANAEAWQQNLRDYQDRLKDWLEKNQPKQFSPRTPAEKPTPTPQSKEGAAEPTGNEPVLPLPGGDPSKPAPAGGKVPNISVRPGFPIQVFTGSGLIRIDNQEGEVTIRTQDGKHTIAIVNADGETVYQGDYDPARGAEGLPKEAQEQLKTMKLDDLKVLGLPQAGKAGGKEEIKIEIEPAPPVGDRRDGLL